MEYAEKKQRVTKLRPSRQITPTAFDGSSSSRNPSHACILETECRHQQMELKTNVARDSPVLNTQGVRGFTRPHIFKDVLGVVRRCEMLTKGTYRIA